MSASLNQKFLVAGRAAEALFRIDDSTLRQLTELGDREALEAEHNKLLDAALIDAGIMSRGDLIAEAYEYRTRSLRCASICGEDGCTGACDF